MEKCETCQFYDREGESDGKGPQWGQCRRQAPRLHPVNLKTYMIEGVWPHVRDDDWCGEWRTPLQRSRGEAPAGTRAPTAPAARPAMLTPLPAGSAPSAKAIAPPLTPATRPAGNSD